ncbi:hypothetical protein B0H99_103178 [Planomicrobium soli]|uniref:DUF2185 domain-containing protein n=1 Tax=Planomicrobium soli TaxID=1176648 RepID=A0A2P8H4A4_9BACL|nr:DUF2185 domain-containing protein [Planomicrobium soli]PSL41044.1 hypothetical protein B0H99_103178 [Planomicrobium soli]
MSWYLDNVYELNKEFPYTFQRPSEEVLSWLEIGDLVKLIFVANEAEEGEFGAERMWVEITEIDGSRFTGTLNNEPYSLPIEVGERVSFGYENICDTEYEDPHIDDKDIYFDTLVTVSNDVLERKEFNFMLRDNSTEDGDSGWAILSGYEEEDFLSDLENFQIIAVAVILNMDDSILEFLEKPPLCAYERNDKGEFAEIEDYDWEGYFEE